MPTLRSKIIERWESEKRYPSSALIPGNAEANAQGISPVRVYQNSDIAHARDAR